MKDDREHCVIEPGLRLQEYHSAYLGTKVIGSTLLFYKPLHILLPLVQEQIPPQPGPPSHQWPEPQLQVPQRDIEQHRARERELEPDVACLLRDRADEPHLIHRRHDKRAREQARAERGQPGRQATVVVPEAIIVCTEIGVANDEMLAEHYAPESARPVADKREEVGEGVVELVRANDRDGDEAKQ